MIQITCTAQADILDSVPEVQRELLRACFQSARVKKQGRRYTAAWVYDCLLMRMNGPKLYRKLLHENKLPLPHESTLRRYIRKLRPIYGFQESVFAILKEKAAYFTEAERHGISINQYYSMLTSQKH